MATGNPSSDHSMSYPEPPSPIPASEPASAADEHARLAKLVVTRLRAAQARLPDLGGGRPETGPPYLRQLDRVLGTARDQAAQVARNPVARADPDLDLWRLREPGYLRNIADHPVARPNGVLVLVPVALTWLILGLAELRYAQTYAGTGVGERPPFFADWIAAPLYRGPVGLAAVIVLSVVAIMYSYGRAKRAQSRADDLDAAMQELEAELHEPLTRLRVLAVAPRSDAATSRAADALGHASVRIGQAAEQFVGASTELVGSVQVMNRLGDLVERLLAALPRLEGQVAELSGIDTRLRETAAQVAAETRPVVDLVTTTAAAATAAAEAVTKSEAAMAVAGEQIAAAQQLGARTAEFHRTLDDAERPFADAAGTVARAAQQLGQTSELLAKTVEGVRETVDKVNWLALVADGLRDGDPHRPPVRS